VNESSKKVGVKTVLLLGLDPRLLPVVTELFDDWGFRVMAAPSWNEDVQPDLLFADLSLIEQDGFTVTTAYQFTGAPVLTGGLHLRKPFALQELARAVTTVLRSVRERDHPSQT